MWEKAVINLSDGVLGQCVYPLGLQIIHKQSIQKRGVIMQEKNKQKKVIVLLGSPRKKGNSTTLAKQIIRGVESAGGQVETVYLNGLNIKPCQGCYACKKEDSSGCAVNDDMQSLYPKLVDSDAWVIASPVYWFTMSAQTKFSWTDVSPYSTKMHKKARFTKNVSPLP